jgi:hypothetical protein
MGVHYRKHAAHPERGQCTVMQIRKWLTVTNWTHHQKLSTTVLSVQSAKRHTKLLSQIRTKAHPSQRSLFRAFQRHFRPNPQGSA